MSTRIVSFSAGALEVATIICLASRLGAALLIPLMLGITAPARADSEVPTYPGLPLELLHVDRTHSRIGFTVGFMGFGEVEGHFGQFGGTLLYDESDLSKCSITVLVRPESIDTNSERRNNHLQSDDFFDVETYPEIWFVSERFEDRNGQVVVSGEITVRDVTKRIEFPVEIVGSIGNDVWGNRRVNWKGGFEISREEFGVNTWDIKRNAGMIVSDEAKIEFEMSMIYREAELEFSAAEGEKPPVGELVLNAYTEGGVDAALELYEEVKSKEPEAYDFGEAQLNLVGYMILEKGNANDAIAVLRLNKELFPESENVYDSLGEAYLRAKDFERARENYATTVGMHPNSPSAREILRWLDSEAQ